MEQSLAKTMEGPKKPKVLVPKRWRVKKPKFHGVLSSLAALDSKTLSFFVVFGPSSVLAPKLWFFWTLRGFGKVVLQNAPKTLRSSKKNEVFVPKHRRVQKSIKTQSFGALGSFAAPDSKTLFLLFFFGYSSVLALCFFWDPLWFWQGFAPKCSQNLEGSQKNQSFDANTLEGPKTNKKTKFWSMVFWDPPWFWQGFAPKCSQNLEGYQRKPKFWCQNAGGSQKT